MTNLLQQLLDFTAAHPSLVGLIVFLSAASEAIVVVGAVVPGTTIILALAAVAGASHASVWLLVLWAAAGAVVGDGVSYWIGHRYGDRLRRMWPFRTRPFLLERGNDFFEKHGGKSVFLARFIPGVRAVVPVVAGMLGMGVPRFYVANVTSALIWAPSHILPAAAVGVAFVALGNVSGKLAVFVGLILLVALAVWLVVRISVGRLAPVAISAYERSIAYLGNRPDFVSRRLAQALDPSRPHLAAIALWSCVLAAATVGFVSILEDIATGDPLVTADVAFGHLIQSVRTPIGDSVMIFVTSYGDLIVIGGVLLVVVSWLALRRAFVVAASVALAMSVATIFMFATKDVLQRSRPIDMVGGPETYSFPSGHATLATALCGIVAVLVSKSLPRTGQIAVFSIAGLIAGAIGLSRIYLWVHWMSDVLAGISFGIGMTAIFALVLYHLPPEKIGRAGLAVLSVAAFAALGTWHALSTYDRNLSIYVAQPEITTLALRDWRADGWRQVSAFRSELDGGREEPIVLQWAGDITHLDATLSTLGWRPAISWSVKNALQFLDPTASLPALPPLPLLNDGRFAGLTLVRGDPSDVAGRLVFRAWPTQIAVTMGNSQLPLYACSITFEHASHPFGLVTTLDDLSPPDLARVELVGGLSADKSIVLSFPQVSDGQTAPILAHDVAPAP